MTLLILALNETNTSMLTRIAESLDREQCRVQYCDGSLGAHEQIRIEQPDVVLAANWLEPRGAGWRVIEELGGDPHTNTIPIVIAASQHAIDRIARLDTGISLPFTSGSCDSRRVLERRSKSSRS